MKKVKVLFIASLVLGAIFMNSCKKDNTVPVPDAPKVSAPSATTDVQVGQSTDVSFNVTVPGGYASTNATAQGGSVTVSSQPDAGAKTGTVVVSFTADGNTGAGAVILSVSDANNKADDATAIVNKTSEPTTLMVDVYSSADGTGTVTWTKDKIYVLRGFIFVNEGQTLTIEKGTVIKGQPGQGAGASALIIARGAKIMAEGTAEAPIIMTGLADNLNGSVPDDANQTWGGLIILGKATTSNVAEGGEKSIEGIPETESRGLYGGTDDADNSGVLTYVSVRHGGSVIGADNEINGISLGAVGSATVLDHIEVFSNFDDGIEFFGGDPNVRHVVLSYTGDDGLDEDEGFHGTVQYALVWKKASTNESSDPRGSEDDGGVGANEASRPFATVANVNVTLFNEGTNDNLTSSNKQTIYMRDGWAGRWINSIFYGFDGPIDMERRTDKINATDNKSASCYDMWLSADQGGYGTLKIEGNLIYTNGAFSNDSTGFANMFVLSDETDAAKEYDVEQYLMAHNKIGDPGFGTGANKFTPSSADVVSGLATGLSAYNSSLEDASFKGAFDPNTTPWYANWTKTWEVINK